MCRMHDQLQIVFYFSRQLLLLNCSEKKKGGGEIRALPQKPVLLAAFYMTTDSTYGKEQG